MRLPLLAVAFLLGCNVDSATLMIRPVLGADARITARPVPLNPRDPAERRVGALTYLGGVVLTSPDPAFGGFSSMRLVGDRFTLLSDMGNLVSFRMGPDWQVRDAVFGDLPGGPGTGWVKADRDAESMTRDPATGTVWVGFEKYNAIYRYDAAFSRVEASVAPPAMADWSEAGGPESMARLRNGHFIVISETSRPKGRPQARIGLRFAGDPTTSKAKPVPFAYVPPAGYNPTDLVELDDGRMLVLNRRFAIPSLFTAKLTLIDLRGLAAGGVVRGRELATFEAPLVHDNFEAMALAREGADTILWIASDDNLEAWEQSLLLKFRLDLTDEPEGRR
ncbi:esterase-like activity of phytase family protein [Sphingomonas sp. CJ20]